MSSSAASKSWSFVSEARCKPAARLTAFFICPLEPMLPQRPQFAPQHFSRRRHRQRVGELHEARIFVGGELHFHELLDLSRQFIARRKTRADRKSTRLNSSHEWI